MTVHNNREYSIGMMARSLAGHDRGKIYLVLSEDAGYVYLADGKIRTVDRPKKKKKIHIQIDHWILPEIEELKSTGRQIQNSDVIRAIKEYEKKVRR